MSNHTLTEVLAKVEAGERLTVDDAITLLAVKGSDLWRVIRAADKRRQEVVGDAVTYVVNYNLNLTNICVNQCQFCGFSTSQYSDSAYLLSAAEIKERVLEAVAEGVSEICLVSGLHPAFDLEYYAQVIAEIKSVEPNLHLHGITPEELHHVLASEAPSDLEAGYDYLSTAGLDSIPGTAAEILVPSVREKICPEKISTAGWIEAIKAACEVGLPATATMMYGHLESVVERAKHLQTIRDIQDETGTFTEFIPLAYTPYQTPLYQQGRVTDGPNGREDLLMIAVARLFLDNIDHIQASWVKYGPKLAQFMLTTGADDLGGTLFQESITREAGGRHGEVLSVSQLQRMIKDLGRTPQERSTLYQMR